MADVGPGKRPTNAHRPVRPHPAPGPAAATTLEPASHPGATGAPRVPTGARGALRTAGVPTAAGRPNPDSPTHTAVAGLPDGGGSVTDLRRAASPTATA